MMENELFSAGPDAEKILKQQLIRLSVQFKWTRFVVAPFEDFSQNLIPFPCSFS